jgi:hypothetical protein
MVGKDSHVSTTLNMIFNVTYYLDLHNAIILFAIDVKFYQVKLLTFYNVPTTDLTFVGKT